MSGHSFAANGHEEMVEGAVSLGWDGITVGTHQSIRMVVQSCVKFDRSDRCFTPLQTNSSLLKIGRILKAKCKVVFQPPFFRGYVSFRECNPLSLKLTYDLHSFTGFHLYTS